MTISLPKYRVALAVTGASGSLYAELALRSLLAAGVRTYLVWTETARKVLQTEEPDSLLARLSAQTQRMRLQESTELQAWFAERSLPHDALAHLRIFSNDDLYAPLASGSEGATHMLVIPASMGSVARIAHGISGNLIERAADVCLKERRTLVIVPRETPLSAIHLQNMLALTQAGAHLVPAMPAFYQRPKSIEELAWFVVERALDALKLEPTPHAKRVQWNARLL